MPRGETDGTIDREQLGDAEELAAADALAAGIVGTLVGDIIASSSGLYEMRTRAAAPTRTSASPSGSTVASTSIVRSSGDGQCADAALAGN